MKKHKTTSTLFYLASGLFNLSAIITFASGNQNSTAVMWLCLGSAFLCLGSAFSRRSKENDGSEDKKE